MQNLTSPVSIMEYVHFLPGESHLLSSDRTISDELNHAKTFSKYTTNNIWYIYVVITEIIPVL